MLTKMERLLDRIKLKELNGASTEQETLNLFKCIDQVIDDEVFENEIPKSLENVILSDIPVVTCKQCIEPLNAGFEIFKKNYEIYLESKSKEDFETLYNSFENFQEMLHFFSDKLMEYGDWTDSYSISGFDNVFSDKEDVTQDEYLLMNFEKTALAIEIAIKALDTYDKRTCMAIFPVFDMLSCNFSNYLTSRFTSIG